VAWIEVAVENDIGLIDERDFPVGHPVDVHWTHIFDAAAALLEAAVEGQALPRTGAEALDLQGAEEILAHLGRVAPALHPLPRIVAVEGGYLDGLVGGFDHALPVGFLVKDFDGGVRRLRRVGGIGRR
jgi:hypothetical protein